MFWMSCENYALLLKIDCLPVLRLSLAAATGAFHETARVQ